MYFILSKIFLQLYDKLRKQMPDFMEKIGIIQGDMGEPALGISEEDRNKIINEVCCIHF